MQDYFEDEFTSEVDQPRGLRRLLALYMRWGGAVVSIALIGLFVLWAYRLGVRDAAEIPVIRALDGPVRVQPDDPGGQVAENQGLEVNEILAGEEAQSPRETQLAPATLQLSEEDTPTADTGTAAVEPGEGVDTAALVEDPEAADPEGTAGLSSQPADAEAAGLAIGELVASVTDSLEDEDLPALDGTEAETEAPLGALTIRPRIRSDAGTFAARSDPASSASSASSVPAREDVSPGTLLIQLGAFDSSEVAAAQWAALLSAHDDLLGTRERFIQRAESNGRIFYRLRVLGFDNRDDQRALCEALGARGVDCIPVTAR